MAEYPAIIEIPRGSRNKYEVDHTTGRVFLVATRSTFSCLLNILCSRESALLSAPSASST
jgi:hypothetical protein